MPSVLARIVKEAFEIQTEEFVKVVRQVAGLLQREDGRVGNLRVNGRLVEVDPEGEVVVIGDLHGDLDSLTEILQRSSVLERIGSSSKSILVFLGDYGDRGAFPAETYYTVLRLKLLHPRQVVLMRGNHEGPEDLMPSPHDLPAKFQLKFKEGWTEVYSEIRGLFEHLYNAVLVDRRYLMIHGGLPQQLDQAEDIAFAGSMHPGNSLLEEILWSDPDETVEETSASPRGAGRLFGKNLTNRILEKLGVKILLRGHEPCGDGFRINHGGKVLTLFSIKGPPYFNAYGAYLDVELDKEFEKAEELIPYIHKF